jgi:hypothetical protein
MTTPRPPFQFTLDLPMPGRSEAPRPLAREVEVATATSEPESPAPTANLMEAICDPENIEAALRAVVRKRGRPVSTGSPFGNYRTSSKRAGRRSNITCSRGATSRNRCVG